jgi:cytochrome P450
VTEANLSPAVAAPAHVPAALVYDFDMFNDPAYLANPHDRILDLIKTAPPIFWTPRRGGHWMLLSHAANFNASRDVETFSNEVVPQARMKAMLAALPPGAPHMPQPKPINLDPPAHTTYRLPLNGAFSPKTVNKLKDSIRELAARLIDKIKPEGRCEFVSAVSEPMPVEVFLRMFGLPVAKQAEYRALVKTYMESIQFADQSQSGARMRRVADIMHDTLIERRDNPRDDVISMLWQTKIEGRATTLADMEDFCVLLFIAGLDTVMNGISLGVCHLAKNPDLQDQLRANPELIAEATEELLRRYTFTVPPRRVAKDVVFQGVEMKAGDVAMLFLPGADLDPKEFANADAFELGRENKVHIAFNAGPHRCLGSHLARVELQLLYETLLARLPRFRLDPARPPKFHGGHVVGVDALHLVWDV